MSQNRQKKSLHFILLTLILLSFQNCSNGFQTSTPEARSQDDSSSGTPNTETQPPVPPSAPTALSAIVISASQIDLNWMDNSQNESGFLVERSVGGAFTQVAALAAGITSYSAMGLDPSTNYVFRVRAYNANGNSAYSNTVSGMTQSSPSPPPPPPPPPPANTMTTVFMASGHMGRTILSCDGGRTWIRDRSDNDSARCWINGPNYVECDHTAFSGRGIDSGDGWFFANFGWGQNGSLRRSRDGVSWQVLRSDGNGGGVAYFSGKLSLFWNPLRFSVDNGDTWQNVANSLRDTLDNPLVFRAGNKFIGFGRANGLILSRDGGETWERRAEFQQAWGGHFAEGNNTLVAVGNGMAALSRDDGRTWSASRVHNSSWVGLIFDGSQFVGWTSSQTYRSGDGQNWTLVGNVTGVPNFNGPIQYNPQTRTYAAIPNIWDQYYDRQRAYVSTDGVNWTMLNTAAFRGSHPINHITAGPMDAANCP